MKTLDSILEGLENLEISEPQDTEKDDTKGVTFWLPLSYHQKYQELQRKTNRKLGKKLAELLMFSIDKADMGKSA